MLVETGLKFGFIFRDERVRAVKTVAEMCAHAYQPFMNFIAASRSSITFEWRRPVPDRTPGDEQLLDLFERSVNSAFTGVVVTAVNRLLAENSINPVLEFAAHEIEEVVQNMAISQALAIVHFEDKECGMQRWDAKTARDAVAAAAV